MLAGLPRRRPITLALVGLGPHPGLTPTPWLLSGVLNCLVEREQTPVKVVLIGDPVTGEAALRKAAKRIPGERGCYELPALDRNIMLRPLGERGEPARIPREIIGTGLVMITPLLSRRASASGRETWLGPVGGALAGFARACGLARAGKPEPERSVAAGHRLITEVFCGASMLIDATWAGIAEPESVRPRESTPVALSCDLVAPEQVLALAELGRLPLPSLLGVDHWLAHLLGSRSAARSGESRPPEIEGTLDRWPHLSATPRAPEPGLAGRAITGLRNQAKAKVGTLMGSHPRAALPARVPGRFASEWTRRWYGEERE